MNSAIVKNIILAIAGAGLGAGGFFAGYKVSQKKYRNIADEEVASVKEALLAHYGVKTEKKTPEKNNAPSVTSKSSIDGFTTGNTEKKNYCKAVERYTKDIKEGEDSNSAIYVIRPEEFQDSDYDTVTLMYYADGILADDDYNIINDIIGTVGPKALTSFGEYEEDAVYVRNDILKIDYEILMDLREYAEIAPRARTTMSPRE